jgi:hypothetical protein
MTRNLTDAELARAYDSLLRARRRAADADAVSLDRMLALVEQRGSDEERLATLDAVMSDRTSAHEFELLRALAVNRPQSRLRWRSSGTVMSLAAVAAVLFVAVMVARTDRSTAGIEPMRAAVQNAVLVDPPIEASLQQSRTFRWLRVAGARSYSIEILTATGTAVFTTRVADTSVTLPTDVPITQGVEYRWWVATEFADGTQRRSEFRRLIVRDTK